MKEIITDQMTNTVHFSALLTRFKLWEDLKNTLCALKIPYSLIPHTQDIWVRDFMPVQIRTRQFALFDYHPSYLRDLPEYRTEYREINYALIRHQIDHNGQIITYTNKPTQYLNINLDGGNIIKCDNSVIISDKIFEENQEISPYKLRDQLEQIFQYEIVIIPHDPFEATGHADGIVRYIGNNTIILNHYIDFDQPYRNKLIKALSPKFNIEELNYGTNTYPRTNWAYLNYLQIGTHIIAPTLGNKLDDIAIPLLEDALHTHVHTINAYGAIRIGGGLNCLSWTTQGRIDFIRDEECQRNIY